MNKAFKQRHDLAGGRRAEAPPSRASRCRPGAGTFYAFAERQRCDAVPLGLKDDNAFAEYLLVEAGVAVVPGSGFGAPNHIRLSFASGMKTLRVAGAEPHRARGQGVAVASRRNYVNRLQMRV